MLPQTGSLIQKFLDEYSAIPRWDTLRTERTHKILPMVLEQVEGDILEIGAHIGTTTKVFCELGANFGRRVYVIDPWDGRQQGNNDTYEAFVGNCSQYENLTVHRCGSEKPAVLEALKDLRFAYILIDGLHEYNQVKHDFTTYRELLNVDGIICIDDWTGPYGPALEIRKPILDNLNDDYKLLASPEGFIENYMVKLR